MLLRRGGQVQLRQVPVHAGPAHEPEHHADRGQCGELQGEEHGPRREAPQRAICSDTGWKPDERQERVQRPRGTTRSARREQTGKDSVRRAVQNGRIVETGSEEREDRQERDGPENEGEPAESHDGDGFHGSLFSNQ